MTQTQIEPEPRWPAVVAVIAVAGLYLALPESLTVGPSWLLPALVGVLLIPTVVARRSGKHGANQIFGYLLLAC